MSKDESAFYKADLTRTILATILALILQIALIIYLRQGGWQVVKSIFKF